MWKAIGGGAAYATVVFAIAFLTGAIRTIVVAQNFGVTPIIGVLIELPILLYIAWQACAPIMKWWRVSPDTGVRALTCVTALIVILSAEYALSAILIGRSLPEFLGSYQHLEALLGLAGQLVFALFPLFRWRPF